MKKLEIKEFGLKSLFKVSIYFLIVPMALIFLIGIVLTIAAAVFGIREMLIVGIIYSFLPLAAIPFYGAIYMLVGLIYNVLAKRFGGLEVNVEEKE
jgi:cytosine/uracil/thiamine/allantoin permease